MKDKIDKWVEEAFNLGKPPNDSLIEIAKKYSNEMNSEIIKRLVEAFNVKSFLTHQKKGDDMEQPFPLADAPTIEAKALKEETKKAQYVHSIEFLELPGKKCEIGQVKIHKVASFYKEKKFRDTSNDTIRFALRKCGEYLKKVSSFSSDFIKELRYLFPTSNILKEAGLDKGEKLCPINTTLYHTEFGQIDHLIGSLVKLSAKKKMEQEEEDALKNFKKSPFSDYYKAIKEKVKGYVEPFQDAKDIAKSLSETAISVMKAPLDPLVPLRDFVLDNTKNIFTDKYNIFNQVDSFIRDKKLEDEYGQNTQKLIDTIKYKKQFETFLKYDPALKGANSQLLLNSYKDAIEMAPLTMLKPELARNYLRTVNSIGTGGMDPQTAKNLIQVEQLIDPYSLESIRRGRNIYNAMMFRKGT